MREHIPVAGDCMTERYFALHPEDDIFQAIDFLLSHGFPGAAVVDEKQHLVGILTEKDCLRVLSCSAYEGLLGGKVKDYMSPPIVTIDPHMDLCAVAQAFLQTNFVCLPVLKDGKLVGRISRRDVLRGISIWLRRRLQHMDNKEKHSHLPTSIKDLQRLISSLKKKDEVAAVIKDTKD